MPLNMPDNRGTRRLREKDNIATVIIIFTGMPSTKTFTCGTSLERMPREISTRKRVTMRGAPIRKPTENTLPVICTRYSKRGPFRPACRGVFP